MANQDSPTDYGPRTHGSMGTELEALGNRVQQEIEQVTKENYHGPVNHPSHYTNHPSGVECIEIVEWMNFNKGNAMKYLWRAGHKDIEDEIESLEKARWYITREIDRLKRERQMAGAQK